MNKAIAIILIIFSLVFIEQGIADINEDLAKAAELGDAEKVKQLIEEGADVNSEIPDIGALFPQIIYAVLGGNPEVVQLLLDAGADPSATVSTDVCSALTWAVGRKDYEGVDQIVKLLIEAGAEVDWQEKRNGTTALMGVAQSESAESGKVAETLLQAGADPNMKDNIGQTALHFAAISGNSGVVRVLINYGADINIADGKGRSVFAIAAQSGLVEIVSLLLADYGVDVNMKDDLGSTALILASEKGHVEVARLLLDAGADYAVADFKRNTALSIAQKKRKQDVVDLLIKAGAEK
jgi:ankyrin repeat protein